MGFGQARSHIFKLNCSHRFGNSWLNCNDFHKHQITCDSLSSIGIGLDLAALVQAQCTDLLSEYCEGTGNNKGVEFYNPTSEAIDLSAYQLQRWSNGEGTATDWTDLIGTIEPHGTWVLVNGQTEDVDLGGGATSPACDPAMQAYADQLDNPYPAPTYMNGDDALVLVKNESTVVDIFGKPGEDPGVAWTNDEANGYIDIGDGATWLTSNHTLRRKYDVMQGVTVPPVSFHLLGGTPWSTWDGLGMHSCASPNQMEELPALRPLYSSATGLTSRPPKPSNASPSTPQPDSCCV